MNTPFRDNKRPTYCNPYGLNGKSDVNCDISDSTLPFPDMLPFLKEEGNQPVETHSGIAKDSISRYYVDTKNDFTGQLYYEWSVGAGATIIEPYDIYSEYIDVLTNSVSDVTFTVQCIVKNGDKEETVIETYTHERYAGIDYVVLTDITENQAGSCEFDTNKFCTAVSTYTVAHVGGEKFIWEIDVGTITSGQGTDSVIVETDGNVNINLNIKCTVSNKISEEFITAAFVHSRTENIIPIAIINSVTEILSGSCDFETNKTCQATSSYSVDVINQTNIWWGVSGGTIISGQSTNTIVVQSDEGLTSNVVIRCTASNEISTDFFEDTYIHERTEIPVLPIRILAIEETFAGTCGYVEGHTCSATSQFTCLHENAYEFLWTCNGGEITTGQGTNVVTVETIAGGDTSFSLICVASNPQYSDTKTQTFMHDRYTVEDPVNIVDITESLAGHCDYQFESACQAQGTYEIEVLDEDVLHWDVTGDITGWEFVDANERAVIVTTDGAQDVNNFVVSAVAVGIYGGVSTVSRSFSHTRALIPDSVAIIDIAETASGFCNFGPGEVCEASSIYQATGTDVDFYVWEITGDILRWEYVTGQNDFIEVFTSNDVAVDFNVKCTAVGFELGTSTINEDFIHNRELLILPDVVISGLNEQFSGFCEYIAGGTCVANTIYLLDSTGADTYVWTVTNGVIVSGQGTPQISVDTDNSVDVTFNVSVVASNAQKNATINQDFTHTREEAVDENYDQALLYDDKNIAMEFIS